jgi:hypothetical protein
VPTLALVAEGAAPGSAAEQLPGPVGPRGFARRTGRSAAAFLEGCPFRGCPASPHPSGLKIIGLGGERWKTWIREAQGIRPRPFQSKPIGRDFGRCRRVPSPGPDHHGPLLPPGLSLSIAFDSEPFQPLEHTTAAPGRL